MRYILLTGMSGAGKTTSLRYLEDQGYPYVDNLPPAMVTRFIELCEQIPPRADTVVMAVDVRSGGFFDALTVRSLIDKTRKSGLDMRVLFIEASDTELVNRFKETRRDHPLMHEADSLTGAIALERERMQPLREMADIVLDSSGMRPRELQRRLGELLAGGKENATERFQVHLTSFGFKRGLPRDADIVMDVRFLPNPFYDKDLRFHTGLDEPVRRFVLDAPVTQAFLEKTTETLTFLLPHYRSEGKRRLMIAVGCTGGAHRSVAIAEALGERLREAGYPADVTHRDIEREKENWKHL